MAQTYPVARQSNTCPSHGPVGVGKQSSAYERGEKGGDHDSARQTNADVVSKCPGDMADKNPRVSRWSQHQKNDQPAPQYAQHHDHERE